MGARVRYIDRLNQKESEGVKNAKYSCYMLITLPEGYKYGDIYMSLKQFLQDAGLHGQRIDHYDGLTFRHFESPKEKGNFGRADTTILHFPNATQETADKMRTEITNYLKERFGAAASSHSAKGVIDTRSFENSGLFEGYRT